MKYLLDTNICIAFNKGNTDVVRKIEEVSLQNCCISEITVTEMRFGNAKSRRKEENDYKVNLLIGKMEVIPISACLNVYIEERVKLERIGKSISDFDLFIAATALARDLILVTDDTDFTDRFDGLRVENWITRTVNTVVKPVSLS